MLAKKNEQENQQLKKENQQLKKENQQLKEAHRAEEKRPDEPQGLQEQINKQNELILGLQEQINKQNEIITGLQNHVNQVFGEEGSIDEEDDDEEAVAIDEEDNTKDDDYDSMSQDTIEGEEPDFSDEEIPAGTDFTKCIGIEQNGEKCIRIRRNGDYCWFHDPENPQVCHKCGKRLLGKQGIVVNGRMKDPTGLFENCDCTKPVSPEPIPDLDLLLMLWMMLMPFFLLLLLMILVLLHLLSSVQLKFETKMKKFVQKSQRRH
jgi:hypothetical protein